MIEKVCLLEAWHPAGSTWEMTELLFDPEAEDLAMEHAVRLHERGCWVDLVEVLREWRGRDGWTTREFCVLFTSAWEARVEARSAGKWT